MHAFIDFFIFFFDAGFYLRIGSGGSGGFFVGPERSHQSRYVHLPFWVHLWWSDMNGVAVVI